MAQEPNQTSTPLTPGEPDRGTTNGKEWERLSPAINATAADSLLSARRQERGVTAPTPETEGDTPAPWTNTLPAVRSQDGADQNTDETAQNSQETDESPAAQIAAAHTETPASDAAATDAPAVASILDAEAEATDRAEARDTAVQDRPRWLPLRRAIIALTVPVLTIMLGIRAIASTWFLWLEYHRPGFPADTYGFDTQERLRLGSYGLDYVLNLAPHTFLSAIETSGTRAFLPTEVDHMTDVKRVLLTASVATVVLLILALISARTLRVRAPGIIRSSIFTGTWITLIGLVALAVIGVLGWEAFFTTFHSVFFPQGNWQFRMSDTLIRLYPPQFWIDAALALAGIVLALTATLLVLTWPTKYRKQLALKRRAERLELQRILRNQ